MRLYNVLIAGRDGGKDIPIGYAAGHLQRLLKAGRLREAAEVLLMICINLHNTGRELHPDVITDIITTLVAQESLQAKQYPPDAELQDNLLTLLTLRTAMLVIMRGMPPNETSKVQVVSKHDLDDLRHAIEEINNKAHELITGSRPTMNLELRLWTSRHLRSLPNLSINAIAEAAHLSFFGKRNRLTYFYTTLLSLGTLPLVITSAAGAAFFTDIYPEFWMLRS